MGVSISGYLQGEIIGGSDSTHDSSHEQVMMYLKCYIYDCKYDFFGVCVLISGHGFMLCYDLQTVGCPS